MPTRKTLIEGAPPFVALGLMILWAAHDGGYDADTWYWGALVLLSLLVFVVTTQRVRWTQLDGALRAALVALALYVALSYLSITWAGYRGDALTGSNRALLYLLVFSVFALVRWTSRRVLAVLLTYALSVGAIGAVVLLGMLSGHHVTSLFSEGRLVSPTGYFNASTALFTSGALVAVGLAARRELPVLLRGTLVAVACGCVQLALLGESRGWLFTLPLVLLAAVVVARQRFRFALAAVLPTVVAVVTLQPLLDVFRATEGSNPDAALVSAAGHAGRVSLLGCAVTLILATLVAAADSRVKPPSLSMGRRRSLAAAVAVLVLGAGVAGSVAATHGHPIAFLTRQWHGFTHPDSAQGGATASHFAVVGSGRYDAWRVALDAVSAHPLGGLGQDNFADYYLLHRRTHQELQWVHSFEFRLLAHTGLIGFGLMAAFLAAALRAALVRRRQSEPLRAALIAVALMPVVIWLLHGSVDWFWEMPALSGPALGFLGMAAAARSDDERPVPVPRRFRALRVMLTRPAVGLVLGSVAVAAAVVALGFPYLSVREVSKASDLASTHAVAALSDLALASKLNPVSADPSRLAGTIALQTGRFTVALARFHEATIREPGGWFAWFGAGLAASAMGDAKRARPLLAKAASLNSAQPAVTSALARVDTPIPLTPSEAFRMLVLAH